MLLRTAPLSPFTMRKPCPCLGFFQERILQHRIDLLIEIPGKILQKLQNCSARILVRVHQHIAPILQTLHRLPIHHRIECNISSLLHVFMDLPPTP